jgi:ABC-type polysaccharide/polyol phosphate transport system ATPase subunit
MSPERAALGTIDAVSVWKRFRADRRRRQLRDATARVRQRLSGDTGAGWRWALRDVNLRAEPGESVGLIGANGSGKSTLLKILTRVMYPYAGRVDVAGRVGALIEVSSGIHGELTGRENVFLYGSILGLKRREVATRFDDIIAFAEIEHAVDRQVKFYSSGMKMRLGFAVAAFLEPDVLLVDEVLAVGDASFQQKCLDRMRQVLADGTTLVFVSHDLAAVEATCTRGLWLSNGVLQVDAPIADALGAYRRSIEEVAEHAPVHHGPVRLVKSTISGPDGQAPHTQAPLEVSLVFGSEVARATQVHIGISEGPATPILSVSRDAYLPAGDTLIRCSFERLPLARGRYYLWAGVFTQSPGARTSELLSWQPAGHVDVYGPALDPPPAAVVRLAPVHVEVSWELEHL